MGVLSESEIIDILEDISAGISNRMVFVGDMSGSDQIFLNAIKDNVDILVEDIKSPLIGKIL